jgi:hypothetical protein
VRAARALERLAQQQPQRVVVDARLRVVGSDDLGGAFDRGPQAAVARDDRALRTGAQVGEFARPAVRDAHHHVVAVLGMTHDACTHHRCLHRVVGSQGGEHAEVVVDRGDVVEVGQAGHSAVLLPAAKVRVPGPMVW